MFKLSGLFLFVLFYLSDCKVVDLGTQDPKSISIRGQNIFVPRPSWGALPANKTTPSAPLQHPVDYVVIHHTYIPGACSTFEECSKAMRGMQTYHQSLGWSDIGYNFCIGGDGDIYEGRGWDIKGAHAGAANSRSVGICLIGDWTLTLPPQIMLNHTKQVISKGVASGAISENYKLIGHQQAMATECPGTSLEEEIATWNHFASGTIKF